MRSRTCRNGQGFSTLPQGGIVKSYVHNTFEKFALHTQPEIATFALSEGNARIRANKATTDSEYYLNIRS